MLRGRKSAILVTACLWLFAFSLLSSRKAYCVDVQGRQSGTWTLAASPYIVRGDIVVPKGMTLFLEPGVVVKFAGAFSLTVKGHLIAVGKSNNPIVLTSIHDRDYFFFSKNNNQAPMNSDWLGLRFEPADASSQFQLQHVIIKYCQAPIIVSSGTPVLKSINISKSASNEITIGTKSIPIAEGMTRDYTADMASPVGGIGSTANRVDVAPAARQPESGQAAASIDFGAESEFSFGEMAVISATRTLQNIIQAPAAISTLKNESIQNYGHAKIPDLFRFMPGMDVFAAHGGDVNVNPRGYNRLYSNRTLVLIDNRIVYTTFFGAVFWNTFPIGLQDIQNIEVLRGPSGSLYGANAVSGVVNITTRRPGLLDGLHVRSFMGIEGNTFVNELSYGAISGPWGYSLSLSATNLANSQNSEEIALHSRRGRAYIERELGLKSRISVDVGRGAATEDEFLPWGPFAIPVRANIEMDYAKVNLQVGNFKLQSYYNQVNFNANGIDMPFNVKIFNTLVHNSLEYSGNLGEHQTLAAGLVARQDAFSGNVTLDQTRSINQFSVYLQDAIRFSSKLSLTLGGRIDSKPETTTEMPVRAALVYSPTPSHGIRFTAAQGFRSPSLVEYFVVSPFGEARVLGSTDLLPEKANSLELGYRAILLNNRLFIGIDLFQETLTDFINFKPVDETTISFANGGESSNTGAEFEAGYLFPQGLRLQATYSYQKIEDKNPFLGFENASPKEKASFAVIYNPARGVFLNVWANYSDRTTWIIASPGQAPAPQQVAAFVNINFYAGYAMNHNFRFAVSVRNALDEKMVQFPGGEDLRRQVTLGLEASF